MNMNTHIRPFQENKSLIDGLTAAAALSSSGEFVSYSSLSPWRMALLYNLKHPATLSPDAPPDALAGYDTVETVQAVEDALRNAGHQVIPLEADHTLVDSIRQVNPDICFNMASGVEGRYRESQIPALLDMYNIPYTGSGVLTLAMTHDKAAVKRMWRELGLPTAPFQVLSAGDVEREPSLASYPLFVKPLYGNAGMGIDANAIVYDATQLRTQVQHIGRAYHQPALVEPYLPGREFTVGIIGTITTTTHTRDTRYISEQKSYHLLPVLEVDALHGIGEGVFSAAARELSLDSAGAPFYSAPADILPSLEAELTSLAIAAFESVTAVDVACVDFRLDANGTPNLLSINTLPSLEPQAGCLAQMAAAEGMAFDDLISEILDLALRRHALTSLPQGVPFSIDVRNEKPIDIHLEALPMATA